MKTLYEVLGVSEPNPTIEEVKAAYEEIETKYKQDRTSVENIEEVRYAYEVFMNPIEATLYVNYGYKGLVLVSPFVRPYLDTSSRGVLDVFISSTGIGLLLLVLLAVFIALRVDNVVHWTWAVVFIPLWILSGLTMLLVAFALFTSVPMFVMAFIKTHNYQWILAFFAFLSVVVRTVLGLVFEIFVAKKLDGKLDWPVIKVFILYFVIEGVGFLEGILVLAKKVTIPRSWWTYGDPLFRYLLRLAFAILIALRIDGTIQCSWYVVFIPTYVYGAKKLVEAIAAFGYLATKPDRGVLLLSLWQYIVFYVVAGVLAYTFLGLLAARLDGKEYLSAPVLFIPIFISAVLLCIFGQEFSPVLSRNPEATNYLQLKNPISFDDPFYDF